MVAFCCLLFVWHIFGIFFVFLKQAYESKWNTVFHLFFVYQTLQEENRSVGGKCHLMLWQKIQWWNYSNMKIANSIKVEACNFDTFNGHFWKNFTQIIPVNFDEFDVFSDWIMVIVNIVKKYIALFSVLCNEIW